MAAAKPDIDTDTAISRFIEALGLSIQQDGLPRIAGRMLGLFIVEGGPFSFSELARRLNVSRGSISTNARVLRHLGLIERIAVPGDRQDFYQLSDEPYERLLDGYTARIRERMGLLNQLKRELPPDSDTRRIDALHRFYAAALETTNDLIRRYREEGTDA